MLLRGPGQVAIDSLCGLDLRQYFAFRVVWAECDFDVFADPALNPKTIGAPTGVAVRRDSFPSCLRVGLGPYRCKVRPR